MYCIPSIPSIERKPWLKMSNFDIYAPRFSPFHIDIFFAISLKPCFPTKKKETILELKTYSL